MDYVYYKFLTIALLLMIPKFESFRILLVFTFSLLCCEFDTFSFSLVSLRFTTFFDKFGFDDLTLAFYVYVIVLYCNVFK